MAALVGLIGTFFSGIAYWVSMLATRTALNIAAIATVATLLIGLYALAKSELALLAESLPPDLFALWGLLMPPNAFTVITAIIGMKISIAIFGWISTAIFKATET